MPLCKLLTNKQSKGNTNEYRVTLPKNFVEEIAKWFPGQQLEVVWIEKGKQLPFDKPYFRISKPDNLWVDKKKEGD